MDKSKHAKKVLERKKENSLYTSVVLIHGRQIKSKRRKHTIYKKQNSKMVKYMAKKIITKKSQHCPTETKNIDALLKLNQILFHDDKKHLILGSGTVMQKYFVNVNISNALCVKDVTTSMLCRNALPV